MVYIYVYNLCITCRPRDPAWVSGTQPRAHRPWGAAWMSGTQPASLEPSQELTLVPSLGLWYPARSSQAWGWLHGSLGPSKELTGLGVAAWMSGTQPVAHRPGVAAWISFLGPILGLWCSAGVWGVHSQTLKGLGTG